jgi:hypothetical protein
MKRTVRLKQGDPVTIHWYDPISSMGWFSLEDVSKDDITLAYTRGYFVEYRKHPKIGRCIVISSSKTPDNDEMFADVHWLPCVLIDKIQRK